jgi:hypothetical protein
MSRPWLRFRLGLGEGDGLLELQAVDAAATHAVAHALALEALMPLLAAVETWLGAGFEQIEPAPATPDWPTQALTLGVQGLGRLALPWQALRVGQALNSAGFTLEWPTLACELLFESLASERIDRRHLVCGGMLLLPSSFASASAPLPLLARPQRAWPRLGGLTWDARRDTLQLASAALVETPSGRAGWEVVAASPCELSVAHWFGGAALPAPMPPPRGVALRHGDETVASGRLVPAGAGIGMLIDACRESTSRAA